METCDLIGSVCYVTYLLESAFQDHITHGVYVSLSRDVNVCFNRWVPITWSIDVFTKKGVAEGGPI
jgi:hypothetical protein